MNNKRMLAWIGLAFVFLASVGFSYAYFSNNITNQDVKDQVVSTGTLELTYVDGPQVVLENMKPGDSLTKEINIKNTGTLNASYNLVWQELTNEIENDEMVIEASCIRIDNTTNEESGTCSGIDVTAITGGALKRKIDIEPNIAHKYSIKIIFKNIDADQNYNQGKKFNGVLGVSEYTKPNFATDSWVDIIDIVKSGLGSEYNVGDTKSIELGNFGTHTVRVANNTTSEECGNDGFSQTACGFVIEFADIISTYNMNSTATTVGGWPASSMYTYLNNDIYNAMPAVIKNGIIDTFSVSGRGAADSSNFTSTDKLYLLAPGEIYGGWSYSYDTANELTRQLDYYKNLGVTADNSDGAIKKLGTSSEYWWFRTGYSNNVSSFFFATDSGSWGNAGDANNAYGVSPAFRIG